MRLEKVVKYYKEGIRADLDAVALTAIVTQPNQPDIIIPDITGRYFIEADDFLSEPLALEKQVMYYSEDGILAEVTPRSSVADIVFSYNGVTLIEGIMAYPSLDAFERMLKGILELFSESRERYLNEGVA